VDAETLIEDALLLVEQNFYFLHAGAFFDAVSRQTDLSQHYDPRIYKSFEDKSAYLFNPLLIQEVMADARQTPADAPTLFEYFVELNAIRGICMATVEAVKLESPFRSYVQVKLGDRFENFVDLVSFVRNVLSHNIHAEIRLDEKDFKGTRERILRMHRNPDIHFTLHYAADFPEIGTPDETYGFSCQVDFAALEVGMPFLEIMPQSTLMKLGELCFNMVIGYRLTKEKA